MTAIRRPGATSAAVLIGLSAALVSAHALAPEWSRGAGLDVWNFASVRDQFRATDEERIEIEARGEEAAARRAAANQIAGQLVAGTIDLPGASGELMEVFHNDQGVRITLEAQLYGVPTERLRFARHAIERCDYILRDDPARQPVVRARLEAEYRSMLASPDAPHAPHAP